jgi:hypothetical protein
MSNTEESSTFQFYFKIPFTEITTFVEIQKCLTTNEFLEYVNIEVRNNLNINSKYDIEVVDAGKPNGELAYCMEPRYDETLLQRYGNVKTIIACYARPVHPITREFIRRDNYFE